MNGEADGGIRQHAGLVQRSLQRLERLITGFSDSEFRPPIRAAARLLMAEDSAALRRDRIALELPRRTVWLSHRRALKKANTGSAAVDLFSIWAKLNSRPIARLVKKTVARGDADEESLGWLREALFYLEIAPRIAVPGITMPQLYGCRLASHSVVLVLEYLEPEASRPRPARLAQFSEMAGRLGAAAYRDRLHAAEWIGPSTPHLSLQTLSAIESVTAWCFGETDEQLRIVRAFENLIGSPDVLARINAQGYSCLAHGDMHLRNVFSLADSPDDVGVIDWANLHEGLIGYDAVPLLLPAFVASAEFGTMDFALLAEQAQHGVTTGALSIDPSLDKARVRLGLDIGLVFQTALLTARNAGIWTRPAENTLELERAGRVASMLRHVAAIAERLLREFGS